jgi:hypothetical protein
MNKNELEAHRISTRAQSIDALMSTVARGLTGFFVYLSISSILEGLQDIVSADPEAITALAKVIKSLNINGMLGIFVGLLGTGGWYYERKGKQRAIRQLAERRNEVEKDDPERSSSNLDHNGHTPRN